MESVLESRAVDHRRRVSRWNDTIVPESSDVLETYRSDEERTNRKSIPVSWGGAGRNQHLLARTLATAGLSASETGVEKWRSGFF